MSTTYKTREEAEDEAAGKETTEEKEKREQAKAKKKASEVKVSARRQRDMKSDKAEETEE